MKTVLFIHGGKVLNQEPTAHFLARTEAALAYYAANHDTEEIIFCVSGRWLSVTESFLMTEAEIGKRYILKSWPEAVVIKEDISVELIGNYAFSKPLIGAVKPDKTIIFTSELLKQRTELITRRIFASDFAYEIVYLEDTVSDKVATPDRELHSAELFRTVFKEVKDGDDAAFREKLLYGTPYYFKSIVDDKTFFDEYWDGGFEHYLHGRTFYKS